MNKSLFVSTYRSLGLDPGNGISGLEGTSRVCSFTQMSSDLSERQHCTSHKRECLFFCICKARRQWFRLVMSVRSEEVALLSRGIPDAYAGRVMARCAGGRQGQSQWVLVWPYSLRHISEGAVGLSSSPVSLVLFFFPSGSWEESLMWLRSVAHTLPVTLSFLRCHGSWAVPIDARPVRLHLCLVCITLLNHLWNPAYLLNSQACFSSFWFILVLRFDNHSCSLQNLYCV